MHVEELSRGARTDHFALPGWSTWSRRAGWWAVSTPLNRGYWYGHRLILPGPPWAEGLPVWRQRWLAEFPPGVARPQRMYLSWESPTRRLDWEARAGDEAGELEVITVRGLRAAPTRPPEGPPGLVCRPIAGDAEWAAALAVDLAASSAEGELAGFMRWAHGVQRRAVEAGSGVWWGAFVDGALVGQLGVRRSGGLGRYQSVAVHPQAGGRKVAAHLLHASAAAFFADPTAEALYVTAVADDRPDRIYAAAGFDLAGWSYELSVAG